MLNSLFGRIFQSTQRQFAVLSTKPTSKRSKSRHQLYPGMPRTRLTRRQTRNPTFNHVLRANDEISTRERHYRRCIVQASCANLPHNPDLSEFVAPYWLKVDHVEGRKQLQGLFDPVVQSVANTRLVRTIVARADPQLKKNLLHSGVLNESDFEQVDEMEKRRMLPHNVPLIDAVLLKCEDELANDMQKAIADTHPLVDQDVAEGSERVGEPFMQHGLSVEDVESVLGSDRTDLAEAKLSGSGDIPVDTRRDLVMRIVGLSTANASEKMQYLKRQVVKAFRQHESDSGSIEVQSAVLTLRIRNLIRHLYRFPQDTPTRVKVDHLTHRRRILMEALRQQHFPRYMKAVKNLGLRLA